MEPGGIFFLPVKWNAPKIINIANHLCTMVLAKKCVPEGKAGKPSGGKYP